MWQDTIPTFFRDRTCSLTIFAKIHVKEFIITSAKEVMFLADFVCLFVCASAR